MMEARKESFKKISIDIVREVESYAQQLRNSYKEYKIDISRDIPHHLYSNIPLPTPIQTYDQTYKHFINLSDSQLTDEEFCRAFQYKIGNRNTIERVCDKTIIKRLGCCKREVQNEVMKSICSVIINNWIHKIESIDQEYLKLILFLLEEYQCRPIKHVS
jgi:hypothetical protein